MAHKDADDPARARPVTSGLRLMDLLEHSALVIAGADLLMRDVTFAAGGTPEEEMALANAAELGLARRKVQLYERMLAEPGHGGYRPDELRDLLAGARARLAELERE